MELKVRYLSETDYDVLCEWWKAFRFPAPPRDFLPENGTGGLMVEIDGAPVVAGFIYFTNSTVAWSEFIISNFEYKDKEGRKEAIKILIIELTELARRKGSKYIYSVVKNQNLKKSYSEVGFSNGSIKVDEMVMVL